MTPFIAPTKWSDIPKSVVSVMTGWLDVRVAMAVKLEVSPSPVDRFYFDHNATTPIAEEVLEAHLEALRDVYGNASSIHHCGQEARQRLERARAQVAKLIGASP